MESARDSLILEHLPRVHKLAAWMHSKLPAHIQLDDLAQAGALGLIKAADKFCPARDVKFWTFAERHAPDAKFEERNRARILRRQIRSLPARTQNVMTVYYFGEVTMKHIGMRIGTSEGRVSQLKAAGVKSLSRQFAARHMSARSF